MNLPQGQQQFLMFWCHQSDHDFYASTSTPLKLYYTILYSTLLYYTIYYILFTIYYILYTIYYILYTIYYILYYWGKSGSSWTFQGLLFLAVSKGPQGQFRYCWWSRSSHSTDFDISEIASPVWVCFFLGWEVGIEPKKQLHSRALAVIWVHKVKYSIV